MKHASFGNRITSVLLTTCGLLGIIVALEWHALSRSDGIETGSNAHSVVTNDVQLTRSTYMAPDSETFSEILERPLFTEGRTPPEPPAIKQASVTPQKQTRLPLRLEGVALTPEARVAVVRDITSNKLFRLAEGEKHQGWVVKSVHSTSVIFKRGEQTHELMLELEKRSPGNTPGLIKKYRRKK